jgi:choline dehydrogenase-like flavoprotein
MFIDARTVAQNTMVQTEVCIIGAGAAGIALALSLRASGFPVAVLESGDLDFDADTQNLDAGQSVAVPNYPLDVSRLRFFGGTTNHWDGWCRPLDTLDFRPRPAIPLSGWPLQRTALISYYEQAQHICEIGPFEYDPEFWIRQTGQTGPKFDPARLKTAIVQVGPPTRFGQTYRETLRQSDNVTIYLNANAVDLQANSTASSVDQVKVATLGGPTFSVRARYVVLATGGLENARILLLSNRVQPAGLGNTYDLVGRYFMDHPWIRQAAVVRFSAPDPSLPLFFGETRLNGTTVFATLAPGEADLTRMPADPAATGGFRIVLQKLHRVISGVDSLKSVIGALSEFSLPADLWDDLGNILHDRDAVADALYRGVTRQRTSPFAPVLPSTGPVTGALLDINMEQAPNPASRVMLSQERDALGQNRLVMYWRLSEMERRTYRRAFELAGLELGRLGIGRVNARPLPDDGWPADMFGSRHHMGTTRMSDDPKTGVVDANCRVHGLSNLYIAGSSVFPTSGYANPTLTIVALALRLGDELRRQMA